MLIKFSFSFLVCNASYCDIPKFLGSDLKGHLHEIFEFGEDNLGPQYYSIDSQKNRVKNSHAIMLCSVPLTL